MTQTLLVDEVAPPSPFTCERLYTSIPEKNLLHGGKVLRKIPFMEKQTPAGTTAIHCARNCFLRHGHHSSCGSGIVEQSAAQYDFPLPAA